MNGLYRVITKNNVKQLQAFQGTETPIFPSVPVGAIIPMYTTTVPSGYLPCNGAEYDIDQFPALYEVLQTNVLPDLRECVLVGAGTNETDAIETHDVYTINEFKDDQFQDHTHSFLRIANFPLGGGNNYYGQTNSWQPTGGATGRAGTTTHGKQKGVFYIIKATLNVEDVDHNVELQNALSLIEQRLQREIDNREDDWIKRKTAEFEEKYFGETILWEAVDSEGNSNTAGNIAVNTTLADSIYNYRYVKFYMRRSAALTSNSLPVWTIDQDTMKAMLATTSPSSNPQLMLPGYASEYRQLTFNTAGTMLQNTWSTESIWKIVGVGKIEEE